ncbi:glycine--tRNA ligase subunit beta [Marinicrinis lubricantis]|uniref:Glycine--tRNA ligase beta subunit n=1 Tax=Marinicrinis lubricantis TaxID=2086470 RepID=A0ABW1IV16_9BACL
MAKDLLLEIGMEEVPARFVRGAMEQLTEQIKKWLDESRISYEELSSYATPRRIAVLVKAVAEKQSDMTEEAKGPAKKIALDEQGEWTKAALGFARGQGVEPSALFFKEMNGVEYVYANKSSVGQSTISVLPEGMKQIITSLHFPKHMRWGSHDLRYVRPIRWLVCLFGQEIVSFDITGVAAGNVSNGHRFLGNKVTLSEAGQYADALKEQYVIVDVEERQQMILNQIHELAAKQQWNISISEDLLEEVLFLVEYPTVLYGGFEPEFLDIPKEVLITSMREHQRYFPVLNDKGELLPYFVTVRNGNDHNLEQVSKGNEKVLRARLSDARFFYLEDQKLAIETALHKLDKIVFHEELGTIGDKVRRIKMISEQISELLSLDSKKNEQVKRTAAICKFDLVTQMVYEFPELQGVMGTDYALKAGEEPEVARAIFEHYQPRFSGDEAPASIIGAVVSIADKLDTLTGCFSIGIIPTGSQDPYALRRQAAGIVQIIQAHDLQLTLSQLFSISMAVLKKSGLLKRSEEEIHKDLMDFFALRVKNVLNEFTRYDVVDAVLAAGCEHIGSTIRRAQALDAAVHTDGMKETVESFNRVHNLAAKAEHQQIQPALFEHDAEKQLFEAWKDQEAAYTAALASGQEQEALQRISSLKQPIEAFFDQVMVMAEDTAVRQNRLALLKTISVAFEQFADFKKLVW